MILCLVWLGVFRRKGRHVYCLWKLFFHKDKKKGLTSNWHTTNRGDMLVCVWLARFSHFSGLCGFLLCSSIQRKRFVASVPQHWRYAMHLVKTSSGLFHLSTIWNVFVSILKCICLHFKYICVGFKGFVAREEVCSWWWKQALTYLSTIWNLFVLILKCICLHLKCICVGFKRFVARRRYAAAGENKLWPIF